ncbi:MAG: ABC transporter permease [Acutalibacteraceae bacterium]
MKKFFQVLKFEYLNTVKNIGFIVSTLIIIAMMFTVMMITSMTSSSGGSTGEGEKDTIAVVNTAVYDNALLQSALEKNFADYNISIVDEEKEQIQQKVNNADYAFAILLDTPTSFTYVGKSVNMMDETPSKIQSAVSYIYRVSEMGKLGVSQGDYDKISETEIQYEVLSLSGDNSLMFIVAMIILMVLYVAILMYGQLVSMSVVTEKNSRAMELLISCAKPSDFIFGKVLGAGLAGLTQMAALFLMGGLTLNFVKIGSISDIIQSAFSQIITTVLFSLIFFVLGFFMYAFLFAAVSSLVSRMEELNTLTTPIVFLYLIAFFAVFIPVSNGNTDGILPIVLSYVPFTAPLEMVVRIALDNVAWYEVVISVVIQIITVYLLGRLSAAVYRLGVMMYGKPPKLTEIFKMLKSNKAK